MLGFFLACDLSGFMTSRARARLYNSISSSARTKKGPAMPGLLRSARREAYRFASVVWIMNFLRIASM